MSSLSEQKATLRELLAARDRETIMRWAREARGSLRTLTSMTFDTDQLLVWRAIEATGWVAAVVAEDGLRPVKDLIRRQLWLMNDESGGLGWHSPELIGEILVNVPSLVEQFAPLLPSFLVEEPFERGTHFAMWRIAQVDPKVYSSNTPQLVRSLTDADAAIRAFAALTLLHVDADTHVGAVEPLRSDDAEVVVYDYGDGSFQTTTVGELVAGGLSRD